MTTAGLARVRRLLGGRARTGWHSGTMLALALSLAALAVVGAAPPAAASAAGWPCQKAAGPFTVHGTQVLGQGGQPFVSYGLTVPGLQVLDWRNFTGLDRQKIVADAVDWCANTVRLQLSQDNLFGPNGTGFDQSYLSTIKSEVALAESYSLVVVINDQTEFGGDVARSTQRGPTVATEAFWREMASLYGNDPQVIFDLFNEPRTYSAGMFEAQKWQLWLNGGWFGGTFYPLGMAQLAAYVRTTLGAQNLFWVEGPDNSDSFAGMVSHGALLKVSNVVYALHHPAGLADQVSWDADLGYLVKTGVAPVVDGEWTNYEPVPTSTYQPPRSSCWPDAPTAVPAYLQYLAGLGIGLNAYQLQPGYLIRSYRDLADPTTMNARTWSCQSDREPHPGQGAGSLLMTWFTQQNG